MAEKRLDDQELDEMLLKGVKLDEEQSRDLVEKLYSFDHQSYDDVIPKVKAMDFKTLVEQGHYKGVYSYLKILDENEGFSGNDAGDPAYTESLKYVRVAALEDKNLTVAMEANHLYAMFCGFRQKGTLESTLFFTKIVDAAVAQGDAAVAKECLELQLEKYDPEDFSIGFPQECRERKDAKLRLKNLQQEISAVINHPAKVKATFDENNQLLVVKNSENPIVSNPTFVDQSKLTF